MTTKRKIIGRLVPCRCFRGEEEIVSVLDYSHCSLQQVPKEVFNFERTLEELYLDANQIEELPKQLFNCQALRKLSIPDNDLSSLPTSIASLVNLKELDISKNGIQDFPENIKCCKCLTIIEASVNPISKLPDGFTQLLNLTQLYLNDAFLEFLPANFGRLVKLRILELRENHLKTLPKSMHKLTQLERLDLGNNEFSELPEVLEQIQNLKELWMDNNALQTLPGPIGRLKQLVYLDVSKNRIESIDMDISGCEALEDLLLSSNMLQQLPDSIGLLKRLTTLKVDDNQLTVLPNAIGNLSLLEEFDCSCNELESLPPTIGYLHSLRTLAVDENFLPELPREIGSCKNVTVMSLRSNKLEFLPDEIGQMQKLRVLNLSDNRLKNLPITFTKLKELAALWLSDNQSKALIPLQTEAHPETKQRVLTNYMFPQQPRGDEDFQSDSDSFNPTLWEEQRQQRMTVAFEFEEKKGEEENAGKVKEYCTLEGFYPQRHATSEVEINLKRYPTPYPEDLKNMVKSVQNLVGKSPHGVRPENSTPTVSSEQAMKEKYEHKWPMAPKEISVEDSFVHPVNDMRIAELRPSMAEAPLYQPKLVLLGKDKKESTDESEADKVHCMNNSVSSGTYSDYSPSQASSGSSNARVKMGSLQTTAKDAVNNSLWGNRLVQSFPQPLETKPLLSQRDSAPAGNMQQHNDRRPMSDTFADSWNDGSHYDNTGFVAEENTAENPSANPLLSSKSRSTSAHGRRPLIRQDRIVGIPLELEQPAMRNTPESEVPPSNPWQNWTRTPSPFEDRTAFPSKLESTPTGSPLPDRKDHVKGSPEMSGTFPPGTQWEYHDPNANRSLGNMFSHIHCHPEPSKNIISISKSTERLSPMMRDLKTNRFKKSQSIDEIDIGAYKVYNIPLENYAATTDNAGMHERSDKMMGTEHGMSSMSRSQSVPMLDDEMLTYGSVKVQQQQKPSVTKKVYQFDQSFNPQGSVEVKAEKRIPPPFQHTPEYIPQQTKNVSKDLVSPRAYRGYPPMEHMFSFSQPSVNEETVNTQFSSQGSRAGYLRRADSLASSTDMSMYRRVSEPQELPQSDRYNRHQYRGAMERQSSMSVPESQFLKRNGRYEDEHPSYQEVKAQSGSFPVKNLTQRRPLSARSYSTESYGTSQTRPVSARPTMAALLEKIPSDYNLGNYGDKPPDNTDIKTRPTPVKGNESCGKMPADWRQQLLRHIEARRLDRTAAYKHNTVNLGMLRSGGLSAMHAGRSMTLNLQTKSKFENQMHQELPLPKTPSQQSSILDNGQEEVSAGSQWNPYPLGRRDVPPETVAKKAGSHIQTLMGSQSLQHRSREQPYEGSMNKVTIQQYQPPLPIQIPSQSARAPQAGRCVIQTKGQRSMDGYPEQFCVRIEKNPGLGFSISGGISGQGNPFKPSDKGIFVTRVQPDGPASNLLQPGDKILQANGHSFVHMEHEKAVLLLKSFQNTVDLVIQRELTV
ncbi:leucine-rich repeat-containing protein 7 isoform X1 [Anolis carolinensis]|uniref:leucine-rich repeat-containing protein 7 isoform X1 n=2 Tax=Anolis carolinensis TaxID=28377 RepID=UPI000462A5A1|nr:PREDICTED: leucine-rich repeat-containing protein 7 isoform X6 [Anolis carolinensis]XP_008116619.1 PREDICTED: leucine-rich repeat-containing protein 7 isoform X6 [Anolis carolinensis]XP_008116620.1 PREDICTED: leucine-rich repeat-containing protein 7 isoform X6 [Anolis carolinensis]XP_008116623.1 PREDICTED: leucine-rich repeat-containing protein 7 isoform X6 [Anolis carolinensis]XP_016851980.1 PREDICTED: leucine-rich repeat-containing protein 7 isoform X6 [Anolis carolinensis]XP_016851981.1 |eukprot:XP_008116618.1 PREDICTED: leucine-rich repeat-containing protein 7 isoform X6 [Anolis carolinensis]